MLLRRLGVNAFPMQTGFIYSRLQWTAVWFATQLPDERGKAFLPDMAGSQLPDFSFN